MDDDRRRDGGAGVHGGGINKMQIRGIRSFSPHHAMNIEFFYPLTLIVGKNGSGKTTIIECLKMACTGSLPPNCRNGQAFVSDPATHCTTEVKAQVKLKFTSATGKPVICMRNFSLTQKRDKKEYKAFEAALQTFDDAGRKSNLSFKCADLNKMVPELMGVSQAVLESVIFVHQEESDWPLAEDKVLKQKFDDIFASAKYTKALDDIRALKNNMKKEEKVKLSDLALAEEILGKKNKIKGDLENHQDAERELLGVKNKLTTELRKYTETVMPLRQRLENERDLRERIKVLHIEHDHKVTATKRSHAQLKEQFNQVLDASPAELKETLATYGSSIQQAKTDIDHLRNTLQGKERTESDHERGLAQERQTLERMIAQAQQHAETCGECDRKLGELENEHHFVVDAGRPVGERGKAVRAALDEKLAAKRRTLDELKRKKESDEGGKTTELQSKRFALSTMDETARAKETEAAEISRRVKELEENLQDMNYDTLQQKLSAATQKFNEAAADVARREQEKERDNGAMEALIEAKRELGRQKTREKVYNDEMEKADRHSDQQSKVIAKKEAAEEAKKTLDEVVAQRAPKLHNVIGQTDPILELLENEELGRKLNEVRKTRLKEKQTQETAHEEARKDVGAKERSHAEVEGNRRRYLADQEAHETEIKRLNKWEAQGIPEGHDFEDALRDADKALRDARAAQRELESGGAEMNKLPVWIDFVDKAITSMESKGSCSMCGHACDRGAIEHAKKRKRVLEDKVTGGQAGHEEAKRNKTAEVARCEKLAETAKTSLEASKKLRTAAADAAAAAARLVEKGQEMQAARDAEKAEKLSYDKAIERLQEVQDVQGSVEHLESLQAALKKAESEAFAAESESGMSGMARVDAPRPKAEVADDLSKVREELQRLEGVIERGETAVRRDESAMGAAKEKKTAAELEKAKLKGKQDAGRETERQVREQKAKASELADAARRARADEPSLRATVEELSRDLDRAKAEWATKLRGEEDGVQALSAARAELDALVTRVERYEGGGGETDRAAAEERVKRAEEGMRKHRDEMKELQKSIAAKEKVISTRENLKVELQQNLAYHEHRQQEEDALAELQQKQRELGGAAGADDIQAQVDDLNRKIEKARIEEAKTKGALEQVTSNVKQCQEELKERKYKTAEDVHRERLLDYKANSMAAADLDQYYKALDRALVRFHQKKMEDINKSIRELWTKTYKGEDIDNIEIKSEHEGEDSAGRRKQSYRVVMKKGDTTLDMRGRCSAGQKVLASLVIRLALAESFCIGCGVLALDEPTTNLDAPNVRSLGEALNEIINLRKQTQSNFQLVCITHDEEFAQSLARNCGGQDEYFKVRKLDSGQGGSHAPYSDIERCDMRALYA